MLWSQGIKFHKSLLTINSELQGYIDLIQAISSHIQCQKHVQRIYNTANSFHSGLEVNQIKKQRNDNRNNRVLFINPIRYLKYNYSRRVFT